MDGNNSRKTETVKNTSQPKWNETFTILVTPHSKINFVVFDRNNFRKDTPVGEKKVELFTLLQHYNGRLDNMEMTLDLMNENKQSESPAKVGELICLFHSLNVDMSKFVKPGTSTTPLTAQNSADSQIAHTRSVLNGIRVQQRNAGAENVVPARSGSGTGTSERRSSRTALSPTTTTSNGTIGPPATVPNGNVIQNNEDDARNDEPLPPGWEMRYDTYGRRYYVDHNTRLVQLYPIFVFIH